MKMSRLALAGVLPVFVLLVCIQLNARAACNSPLPLGMQSWFSGDHIWELAGTLYNGPTDPEARIASPSQSKQVFFEDRVVYQRAIEEVYCATASGRSRALIPSQRSKR